MTIRDLLIFMAVITILVLGITGIGWVYFVRWYREEQRTGRRHIDSHLAEVLHEAKAKKQESENEGR